MNAKEQLKLDIVSRVSSGKISFKNALKILNVSESTLFRYLRKFETCGMMFVKHKNAHKKPANKMAYEREEKIIDLCRDKYYDFNRSHAREELEKNENIYVPKNTFNQLCNRHNLLKKNVRRRKKTPRHRRERMLQMGLMVQMDGSPHKWFARVETCLVIAIDDATSDILYGEFSPTETTFACMNVSKKVLSKYGIFQILYTDRAGIFGRDPIDNFDAVKRGGFSQLKKCLQFFSIHVIHAQSPEAKGRVERAFKTLQDRLVPEMRLAGINSINEANRYFNEVYLPKHRDNFVVEAAIERSAFVKLHRSVNLDERFYASIERKIKNDHTFSIDGKLYDVHNGKQNYSGATIEIRTYPNSQVKYFIDEKEVQLRQLREIRKRVA
jgi:transposase